MPRLTVNGQNREIKTLSIEAVLEAEALPHADWASIAVAQNGTVIPKSAWNATALNENDAIDIVRAFAGG